MTALTGKAIKNTYKDVLQVSNSNTGIDGTLRNVEDGGGTTAPLKLSSAAIELGGTVTVASGATVTVSGTVSNLGSVTTADINGGTIDGAVIGGASAAAGTFTTLAATSGTVGGVDIATISGTQTLTNKTISADSNTLSGIAASSFVLSNASGNLDGAAAQKAIPSGVVVGTTDTQTLTNKTINGSNNTLSNVSLTSAVSGVLPIANGGTNAATAAAARTNLGLVIGTDVQAYDALLADIAGLSITQGSIIYGVGTDNVSVLAKGTADQVLTMNAGATAPEWADAAGGLAEVGSWDFSVAVSEVTFTGLTYNTIIVVITGLSGGTMEPRMQFSTDNGVSYISTASYYDEAAVSAGATHIGLNGGTTIGSGEDVSGRISISGFNNSALGAHCHVATVNDAITPDFTNSSAGRTTAAAYNALRIFPSAGSFDAGSIRVYAV